MYRSSHGAVARVRLVGGRYELHEIIGGGSFGSVWASWDRISREWVAVKLLKDPSEEALHRFLREQRLIIDHHHIASPLDVGFDRDTPYLVMKLITGGTLAEHLADEGPLDVTAVEHIVVQVLDALEHLRSLSIVHRDIQPSNLLLHATPLEGGQLRVELADFGNALRLGAGRLTTTATIPGTPGYRAPEVCQRFDASASSDLFSLAVVAYEAATGVRLSPRVEPNRPDGTLVFDGPQDLDLEPRLHLRDLGAMRLPRDTSREDRARVQLLGAAFVALAQGVAYYHAGIDVLRSKSLDKNSFDSGDAFNRLDWTLADNGFGAGLPKRADNGGDWPWMRPVLADARIKPAPKDIAWMAAAFRDLLRIRASSTLFRLRSADEVAQRLTFPNSGAQQDPRVVVAHLDGDGLDGARFREVLYFLNASTDARTLSLPAQAGKAWTLHPVQRDPRVVDARARDARVDAATGTFSIPPRSVVVYVVE